MLKKMSRTLDLYSMIVKIPVPLFAAALLTVVGRGAPTPMPSALQFGQSHRRIVRLVPLTMRATTSDVSADRIATSYTGTTTCEGPITDGTLTVTR